LINHSEDAFVEIQSKRGKGVDPIRICNAAVLQIGNMSVTMRKMMVAPDYFLI
jgi:hypothetical protein